MRIKGKFIKATIFLMIVMCVLSMQTKKAGAVEKIYEAYSEKSVPNSLAELYVREKGSREKGEVVYCYNEKYYQPNKENPTPSPYSRIEFNMDTSNKFLDESKGDREYSGSDLYKMVKRILALGYPNNVENIQGSLSDEMFRAATQRAIWSITDGYEDSDEVKRSFPEMENMKNRILERAKAIHNGKEKEIEYPSDIVIDIYQYNGKGLDGIPFQNMLGARFIPKSERPDKPKPEEPSTSSDKPKPELPSNPPTTPNQDKRHKILISKVNLGGKEIGSSSNPPTPINQSDKNKPSLPERSVDNSIPAKSKNTGGKSSETGTTTIEGKKMNSIPKTGDSVSMMMYILIMLVSGIGIFILSRSRGNRIS